MTKKLLTFFLLFFLVLFFTHRVRADYATAYQAYLDKTGVYQTAYNAYLTARSNYLASRTLDSQDKAMSATLKMLQARDDVISYYLAAVKEKINTTKGIASIDQSTLTSQISQEISWYANHNTKLTSAGSLNDLVSDSDEAKNQFNNSTLIIIYQSIVDLGIGNNNFITGELNNEITLLQAKIAEIKANQDKNTSLIERSLVDVQNKISRSQDKDNEAKNLVNAIKPADQQKDNDFQDAQASVTDANSYLKEANDGLLQIIAQIKSN